MLLTLSLLQSSCNHCMNKGNGLPGHVDVEERLSDSGSQTLLKLCRDNVLQGQGHTQALDFSQGLILLLTQFSACNDV